MEYSGLPNQVAHHILLEGREQLTVSGVEEVESFDENTIVMLTVKGTLVVRGEDLHIEKLSLDGGDLKVEGTRRSDWDWPPDCCTICSGCCGFESMCPFWVRFWICCSGSR